MSFPEYLKGRISEDYKNIIIQKLQEVKDQTEDFRNELAPFLLQMNQSLRESVQQELARMHQILDAEASSTHDRITEQVHSAMEQYLSSWYHSDISAFEQQLEILISDIVSNVPAAARKESEDLHSLVDLMHRLDRGNTQSEILNILLQHISGWVGRAVLFVVKGDQANGWASLGLGSDWDGARVRQIRVDLNQQNVLRQVLSTTEAAYGPADQYADNAQLFMLIGSTFPRTALAFPVMVRGKLAGIFYADLQEDLTEKPDLPNHLYLACRVAGYAIDLLPLKSKTAPPRETAMTATQATVPALSVAVVEAEPVKEEKQQETAATVIMVPPVAQVIPLTEEEQKLHDDAKRFARLLVSEIKLYNEAQVSAGRENKDLYERLRDDIERSRKMYMNRVSSHIYTSTNYFYEELVRSLANGDATLLGM